MIIFRLTVAILALASCFCDCAPKGKKVTFTETLDLMDPPDGPDVASIINFTKFEKNVKEKYKLYDKKTHECEFLEFIFVVVGKTYSMWDKMYRAVNLFDSYAVILGQTNRVFRGETLFPDPKTFESLESYKTSFKNEFANLLRSIRPAHEINTSLISLVDRMNNSTRIDATLMPEMHTKIEEMLEIHHEFDDAFKFAFALRKIEYFTGTSKGSVGQVPVKQDPTKKEAKKLTVMEMYRKSLSDIRVIVIKLECNNIDFNTARAALKKIINMLHEKIYPSIEKSLYFAKSINFIRLCEAMETFWTLARRALNVEEASSSN